MKQVGFILGGLLLVAVGLFASGLILAFPVMWLWNYLMPDLFHLSTIGYWQAFCLYYMCGLLFKSVISK